MLGNITKHYFTKGCTTSHVIDILESKKDDVYYHDTLMLYRMFHLYLINPNDHKTKCFTVSLYIKRDEDCDGPHINTKLTLSKIKKAYAEQYIDPTIADNDMLLPALINELGSLDWEKNTQDIMLETTISFRAQGLADWSEKGKTKTYHIVGVSLEG